MFSHFKLTPYMKKILIVILVLIVGCKEQPSEQIKPTPAQTVWSVVPPLAQLSIRYMLQYNGTLYVSAHKKNGFLGRENLGFVYQTTDGENWTLSKGFTFGAGPMTMHGDTLYVLCDDTTFQKLPNGQWRAAFATPARLAGSDGVGDIVFYQDVMYGMQTLFINALETDRVFSDGSWVEVLPIYHRGYSGAKFLRVVKNGVEEVYVRPRKGATLTNALYSFDGNLFYPINQGLTDRELLDCPTNTIILKGDTIYMGFLNPASIKRLINGQWESFKDTLPNWKYAMNVQPPLITEPTGVAFAGERCFVSTQCLGVLEWKNDSAWVAMSNGLLKGFIPGTDNTDLYSPVIFLEYFNGKLFAGYGDPASAPWANNDVGLYQYNLH
jgi:hypothetical protein